MSACPACGAPLPEGARFCPACARPIEESADPGERKLATVLFADLVGSTQLGEQDPERTRALLTRFYDAMRAEVESAGGTVEKYAGDAVMAAFGAPAALEDHPERALHTALAMRRRLDELFAGELALRVGVNTGEVVVGKPREGSSFVTGDAVNVAARLEQAAAPGEILAGERAAAAARGAFEFDEPTTVEAKGKPAGVTCRRVVRALSLMRPRGVGGLRRAFVGRAAELDLLRTAFRTAVDTGEPQLVMVSGDAGVGKTRLARELWEWLGEQSPEPLRRTGRCLSYGKGITYWPLAEALKEHLGILDSDPPETVLDRLEGREILGLTLGLDVAGGLHPLVARDRLYDAWVEFLEELSGQRPTVLLVEDLHWAEEHLLDLLERVAAEVRGPLLLLTTARPEIAGVRPGWPPRSARSAVLTLEPLSADDTRALVDDLLAAELPPSLREAVVERAEGNAFFVEELVGTLIDRGVLARTEGGWAANEVPEDFSVPDSVQAVLAARMDLLAPADKAALQAAAVMGRIFWASPVYELLGPGLEPSLRLLEERDFVRRRAGSSLLGEQEYAIKHALTREVAYESLPKAKRARLHAAFAEWTERAGEGRDEHAPLLAHHYAAAVRPEDADLAWAGEEAEAERLRAKAVAWLRRASELAVGRYDLGEAAAMLEGAIPLEATSPGTIELLRRLAHAQMLAYDVERFRESLEQALALQPERAIAAEIYADLALYGYGRPYMWREPPSEDVGERWAATALELAEPATVARGAALAALALARPEEPGAEEAAAEALEIGETLGVSELEGDAYEALSLVASIAGRVNTAQRWAERAVSTAVRVPDPGHRAHVYWLAGFVELRAGRPDEVAALADAFDSTAESLTPHDRVHGVALRALLESATGRWRRLSDLAAHAEAAAVENEAMPCQFNWRSLLVCALGHAHLGHEREARRLEELARAQAVVAGPAEREPALLRLALLRGELDEAGRILGELPARIDAWGLDAPAARLDALAALGRRAGVEEEAEPFLGEESYTRPFALRALGLVRRDAELLDRAMREFEAIGLGWRAEETRLLARR